MDTKINLSQLSDLFQKASGLSKTDSDRFVRAFFDIISENVLKGEVVKIKGLGTFKLSQMADRESVNVNTGERFVIEGHQKISFLVDASLKEIINKPFADFEVVELNDTQAKVLEEKEKVAETEDITSEENAMGDTTTEDATTIDTTSEDTTTIETTTIETTMEDSSVAETIAAEIPTSDSSDDIDSSDAIKNQDNESQLDNSKKVNIFWKIALYASSTALTLLLIFYIIWPLNLVDYLRDYISDKKEYKIVEAVDIDEVEIIPMEKVDADTTGSVQKLSYKTEIKESDVLKNEKNAVETSAVSSKDEQVSTVPKPETKEQVIPSKEQVTPIKKSEVKEQVANNDSQINKTATTAVKQNNSTNLNNLVLLDIDNKKDLSQITISDTINYRISGTMTEYEVKSGETLTMIAFKYYGTKKLWPYIVAFNKIGNSNSIKSGDIIKIPILINK